MSECVYTAGEIIAALRQVRGDYLGMSSKLITDRERLTAFVAISELAQYLGITADEYENRVAHGLPDFKS